MKNKLNDKKLCYKCKFIWFVRTDWGLGPDIKEINCISEKSEKIGIFIPEDMEECKGFDLK